jgi:hypothetical protein
MEYRWLDEPESARVPSRCLPLQSLAAPATASATCAAHCLATTFAFRLGFRRICTLVCTLVLVALSNFGGVASHVRSA